jgi:hypothetical protein
MYAAPRKTTVATTPALVPISTGPTIPTWIWWVAALIIGGIVVFLALSSFRRMEAIGLLPLEPPVQPLAVPAEELEVPEEELEVPAEELQPVDGKGAIEVDEMEMMEEEEVPQEMMIEEEEVPQEMMIEGVETRMVEAPLQAHEGRISPPKRARMMLSQDDNGVTKRVRFTGPAERRPRAPAPDYRTPLEEPENVFDVVPEIDMRNGSMLPPPTPGKPQYYYDQCLDKCSQRWIMIP